MPENFDELFNDLIDSGAVELTALDQNGNPLYSFTDKIFEIAPKFARQLENAFHEDMMTLWELNFLEMDVTLLNPVVRITDKAKNPEEVSRLSDDLRITLETIKNAMRIEP